MKRIILLIAVLTAGLSVYAQSFREVVYLKNGSMIKGIIIEQVPNESLKIQTADGSVFVYKIEDVEKITKEVYNGRNRFSNISKLSSNTDDFHPQGYRGFLDLDGGFGLGERGDGIIGFTTSHGYQDIPHFYIGGGFGVHYHAFWKSIFVPIFANVRFNFLDKRCTPFLDIKGGYSPGKAKGGYLAPSFGVNYQFRQNLGINFSFGYTMQRSEFIEYNIVGVILHDWAAMHHLGFKLGIEF